MPDKNKPSWLVELIGYSALNLDYVLIKIVLPAVCVWAIIKLVNHVIGATP